MRKNDFKISSKRSSKIWLLLFLMNFWCFSLLAQTLSLNGNVKDNKGEVIVGANIVENGTTNGTITDANGKFNLDVKPNATLIISYIGYISQKITVGNKKNVSVVLNEDTETLDEVVVVGYGTMRKRDLTGAVSQIKAKEMTSYTVSNPIQSLQGRVPGVVVSSNTGAPAGSFQIRVRGSNSIKGDNSPLYIIDGIPADVNTVNSYDIASLEVLKDASATAIYGSRGANGVILITTKKGEAGNAKVTYNFDYGIQSQIKKWDLCDAGEWMQLINIQQLNDVGKVYFSEEDIKNAGKGYDWQENVFKNAPMQTHNLNISGGSENSQYFISTSAQLRDGLIKNSSFNKYNLRANINTKINDYFKVNLITGYTRTTNSTQNSSGAQRGSSLISSVLTASPATTPYNEDGTYRNLQLDWPFMSNGMFNPINIVNESYNKTIADIEDIQGVVTYNPLKNLTIRSSIGFSALNNRYDSYASNEYLNSKSNATVSSNQQSNLINENIVNYNLDFLKNNRIDITGGITYQQYINKGLSASGTSFLSDITESYNLGSASTFGTPSSSYTKWQLLSYLLRGNYSYKGKYLATFSIRADGSSRYSENNKWGYFPSAALAWRVSDEKFMKNIPSISDLKLRLEWGKTGSQAISPYTTLSMLSSGQTALGTGTATLFTVSSTYPGKLKWETTDQWNLGLDFGLLNQKLRIAADYYNKLTHDLLNSVTLPPSSGYSNTIQNIGKMRNKGFELSIEGDIFKNTNIIWTLGGNISINKNKVETLYNATDLYQTVNTTYMIGTVSLIREGEPLGVFYVFKEDGYDENGNIKYVDVDNNGSYNNKDRFILGDPNPDFTYGINSDLNYKNWEFSIFMQGSQGNDIYNLSESSNLDYGWGLNMNKKVLYNHWDTNSPNAKYPKITKSVKLMTSDRYIEDGSYLRLKNIVLAYNIPMNKFSLGKWIAGVRIYVSAQNILTFTKYSGADPEVNSWGGSNSLSQGYDYLSYPNSKSISWGLKVQF